MLQDKLVTTVGHGQEKQLGFKQYCNYTNLKNLKDFVKMRYTIHTQHCDFFKEHHAVEFEAVLSPSEVQALITAIDESLALKLEIKKDELRKHNSKEFFASGRDLWRVSHIIKKFGVGLKLAQIAFDLTQVKPLRLAFDQYIPKTEYLNSEIPFDEGCCIQGFVCGVLIQLEGPKAGNAIYFSPQYVPVLPEGYGGKMFIVGYAQQVSLYVHHDKDPHLHDLKRLGYNFGDRLNDKLHPLIHNLQG